jgi:tetratricopeptide (TPR) repeat protein
MKKDYDACLAAMTKVLAMREQIFGPESLPAAKSRLNLGSIAITKQDFKLGLEHTDAALPIFRKQLGEQHMDVAQALRNRAMCLRGLGDTAAALRDYQSALVMYDALTAPAAAVRIRTLVAIMEIQCAQGLPESAQATAALALKVLDAKEPAQARLIKSVQDQLAKCKADGPG